MRTLRWFSEVVGVEHKTLTYILYNKKIENFYKEFQIPKKNGGYRNIKAPQKELLFVQKRIAKYFSSIQGENNNSFSYAFQKNKSIILNASKHVNRRYLVNIDL